MKRLIPSPLAPICPAHREPSPEPKFVRERRQKFDTQQDKECVYFLNLVQYDIKNCKKNHKNLRMSEKSCIFAAFFSAIRYYLCGILPAKSCKICVKTTAKSL